MIETLIVPVVSVGALAVLMGSLLGFSAKKFYVRVDPRVEKIQDALPGVNCGGCGFPGCGMFAKAVAEEKVGYNGCPPGGADTAGKIAETLGIAPDAFGRKVAFLKCNGVEDNVKRNYIYDGPKSCVAASQLATGGNKSCTYSCIGLASCKNACPFDAIHMANSIAVIDSKKCTACGKCVTACPKKLIEIVAEKSSVRVLCNSRDTGKIVRQNCRAGCIACSICKKACTAGAITMENNIATIDYEKCTLCMACVAKCPTKSIKNMAS
ncbi:MAG: RnfABCDGE type electron transport complex subunit B [Spirochaetes bacterium]|nr:RnfABCDGE type electron transport complex subunit B [Spirochaetota bacterium]